MTLFFSLLPLYLFGNLHCLGMCGPLVMLIGPHRYRLFYFFGRTASFSLAGFLAGELGAVLHLVLKPYRLAEGMSLVCGAVMTGWGLHMLVASGKAGTPVRLPSFLKGLTHWISTLLLRDRAWPTFLFGFLTVALPCGQTLVVFSACALSGDAWVGLANGFAFALLTTPSLALAMQALGFFKKFPHYDRVVLGGCSLAVGMLAVCRGLAEAEWIPHWVVGSPEGYHLVLF